MSTSQISSSNRTILGFMKKLNKNVTPVNLKNGKFLNKEQIRIRKLRNLEKITNRLIYLKFNVKYRSQQQIQIPRRRPLEVPLNTFHYNYPVQHYTRIN